MKSGSSQMIPFHSEDERIGCMMPIGSRMPMIDTSVVSLNSPIKVFTIPGMEIFSACGAVHMQVGKSYPYMKHREATSAQLLQGLKRVLDPDGLMNPGALGL